MKEFKNVLNRLPKQEVNLSSEKVQLDMTADLDKLADELKGKMVDLRIEANNRLQDAIKALEKSKALEVEMEKAWNKAVNRVKAIDDELAKGYEKTYNGIPNQVYAMGKVNEKAASTLKGIKLPR